MIVVGLESKEHHFPLLNSSVTSAKIHNVSEVNSQMVHEDNTRMVKSIQYTVNTTYLVYSFFA